MNRTGRRHRSCIHAGTLLLIILTVAGLHLFCAGSYRISTGSMSKALQKGDFVLANKLHGTDNPGRNRIVLYGHTSADGGSALLLSRCAGMPGDTVCIASGGFRVGGRWFPDAPAPVRLFRIRKDIRAPLLEVLKQLEIPCRNVSEDVQSLTIRLTAAEERMIRENLPSIVKMEPLANDTASYAFVIPFKGYVCRLDSISLKLYREAIRSETDGRASMRDGKLWMDDREVTTFLFRQNYYWMLSDEPEEAVDSRHLGLIPEGSVVGNVWFCWFSKDRKRIFRRIR
ncbi:MAG: S26 family signal peptidase [Tannerella sp.]|jgi:signal peptidase I|nr:S26 family signal peptidase [Tannerella sp.]